MIVVTLHDGGGSRVEAASPSLALGPFANTAEAEMMVRALNRLIDHTPHLRQECWAQVIEVADLKTFQHPTPGVPVTQGQLAVDLDAILKEAFKS